jgi:hypothetical protein
MTQSGFILALARPNKLVTLVPVRRPQELYFQDMGKLSSHYIEPETLLIAIICQGLLTIRGTSGKVKQQ